MEAKMLTLNEMRLLHERAKNYLSNSPMAPINSIYRDKTQEYFDQINDNARLNRGDKFMQSFAKNASGHPECPIVFAKLKGIYFATACKSSGNPLPTSLFGDRRISISAEYLLDPKRYNLYFADFYCTRYSSDFHKITLALCEIGSRQDFFCREHLIKLNVCNNPFLQCITDNLGNRQCFIAANKNCPIYLFLCADFNISNCFKNGKCVFSEVKRVGFTHDDNVAAGQTYDDRCSTCGIHNLDSSATLTIAATFGLLSLAVQPNSSNDWRIWKFVNNDLPNICALCKTRIEEILPCNPNRLNCKLCRKFVQVQQSARGTIVVASDKRWENYIKKIGAFFSILPNISDSIRLSRADLMWPSWMAQQICFNRKVGIGIFREGIVPDCDHESQQRGGYFFMILFEKVGNHDGKIDKLDHIFDSFLHFIFGGGLSTVLFSIVSGIFVRAEIQPNSKNIKDYTDPNNLPAKFRFELWIQDMNMKEMFWKDLNRWTTHVVQREFGFGREAKFSFFK